MKTIKPAKALLTQYGLQNTRYGKIVIDAEACGSYSEVGRTIPVSEVNHDISAIGWMYAKCIALLRNNRFRWAAKYLVLINHRESTLT